MAQSKPITITATLAAWVINSDYSGPGNIVAAIERGDSLAAIQNLAFYGSPDKEKFCDYVRMGEADITVRLLPKDEQVRAAVVALNAKLQDLRAAYMQRQSEIMEQISKLQALEYVEAS